MVPAPLLAGGCACCAQADLVGLYLPWGLILGIPSLPKKGSQRPPGGNSSRSSRDPAALLRRRLCGLDGLGQRTSTQPEGGGRLQQLGQALACSAKRPPREPFFDISAGLSIFPGALAMEATSAVPAHAAWLSVPGSSLLPHPGVTLTWPEVGAGGMNWRWVLPSPSAPPGLPGATAQAKRPPRKEPRRRQTLPANSRDLLSVASLPNSQHFP